MVLLERNGTPGGQLQYATQTRASFAEHYITPYLVARPGEHLTVLNTGASNGSVDMYVSGLLTTNVNYLPLITR